MLREWRRNFFTGLLTLLPLVITLALITWFFKKIDNIIIGQLVNLLPKNWIESVPAKIFWKLISLSIVIVSITFIGIITRNVLVKKILELAEKIVVKVPLVNKIYTTAKEIRDTFVGRKRGFNRVVLVEYPRKGIYTIGFVVNPTAPNEVGEHLAQSALTIFLPTTPNPTSGLLIFVPERETVPLKISIQDTMKLIISGGTINL